MNRKQILLNAGVDVSGIDDPRLLEEVSPKCPAHVALRDGFSWFEQGPSGRDYWHWKTVHNELKANTVAYKRPIRRAIVRPRTFWMERL